MGKMPVYLKQPEEERSFLPFRGWPASPVILVAGCLMQYLPEIFGWLSWQQSEGENAIQGIILNLKCEKRENARKLCAIICNYVAEDQSEVQAAPSSSAMCRTMPAS